MPAESNSEDTETRADLGPRSEGSDRRLEPDYPGDAGELWDGSRGWGFGTTRSVELPPASAAALSSVSLGAAGALESAVPAVPAIQELRIQRLTPRPRTEPGPHPNSALRGRRNKSLGEAQAGRGAGLYAGALLRSLVEEDARAPAVTATEGLESEQAGAVILPDQSEAVSADGNFGKKGEGIANAETSDGKVRSLPRGGLSALFYSIANSDSDRFALV